MTTRYRALVALTFLGLWGTAAAFALHDQHLRDGTRGVVEKVETSECPQVWAPGWRTCSVTYSIHVREDDGDLVEVPSDGTGAASYSPGDPYPHQK